MPIISINPKPVAEVKAALSSAVQRHLDETAQSRGYDGILSLCTYLNSPNPTFAAEAQAGVTWRDAVWTKCYKILSDVESGVRPAPTAATLIAELPLISW